MKDPGIFSYDKLRHSATAYDANGNTLSDPSGKSYSWDFENRLTQAVVPGSNGGTTTFKYDPFGRRIQKSGPLGTTNKTWGQTGRSPISRPPNNNRGRPQAARCLIANT